MFENYRKYKAWWIEYRSAWPVNLEPWAVSINESDFENHLNEMTRYEFMETLYNWR